MAHEEEFASLRQRIADAERARDRWRAVGQQERYLEACSTVSALDVQLDELRQTQHREADRPPGPSAGS